MQQEFWPYLFGKPADKVKHQLQEKQGITSYFILDYNFRFLARISCMGDADDTTLRLRIYSSYVVGLVKGALANLGACPIEVTLLNDFGKHQSEKPFELVLKVLLPIIKE